MSWWRHAIMLHLLSSFTTHRRFFLVKLISKVGYELRHHKCLDRYINLCALLSPICLFSLDNHLDSPAASTFKLNQNENRIFARTVMLMRFLKSWDVAYAPKLLSHEHCGNMRAIAWDSKATYCDSYFSFWFSALSGHRRVICARNEKQPGWASCLFYLCW